MSLRTRIAFALAAAGAVWMIPKVDVATLKHAVIMMASAVWGS